MRRNTIPTTATLAVMALACALAGCGGHDGLPPQADAARLAVDAYGCPDLGGRYQLTVPGEQDGVRLQGSLFELVSAGDDRIPASQIKGLQIERTAPGRFRFRFFVGEERVRQSLEVMREFEKPRYREWYHLQAPDRRAEAIAADGQAAYDARMAELGPRTFVDRDVSAGVEIRCDKGWIEIQRGAASPIRMSLSADGALIGRSQELDTTGITVWCGDGCKQLPVPTGRHDGLLYWGRSPDLRPWRPEDAGGFAALARPLDEIEAETAARAAEQARRDAERFLPADAIRDALARMAPPGTAIDAVEVRDGEVRIRYTAPNGQENQLLTKIEGAGGDAIAANRIVRGGTSSDPAHTWVELRLSDSPLVLRAKPADSAAGADATDSTPAFAPALYAAAATSPTGDFADADTIRGRIARLMPPGCRATQVRHGEGSVTVYGQAETTACISDTLRAIEQTQAGAAKTPELVSIESAGDGSRRNFRIMLAPSALTRR